MANTPHWAIPLLTEGQASGEVTHNDAIIRLAALTHLSIIDNDLTAPPGSPSNGDRYIVAGSPTGDWASQAGKIAFYYNGWIFFTPVEGMIAWIVDENLLQCY